MPLPKSLALTLVQAQDSKSTLNPTFTLTIQNNGKSQISLEFTSGQQVEFTLFAREGTQIGTNALWRWSDEMAFTQAFSTLDIAPGSAKTFTVTLNTRYSSRQLPAGEYQLQGGLLNYTPLVVDFTIPR